MIEERKTHYSERKYCDILGGNVLVEQIKVSEIIIVRCRYANLGDCDIDIKNPRSCLLKSKLVNIIKE